MTARSKPVWVWLPGQPEPLLCGRFTLEGGVGRFVYDPAYRAMPGALALDPLNLPFTRSARGWTETRQGGLFGVFRDASPEGFGLALLEQLQGQALTDPLQRLELSEGDAVGAVEVCDDIERKQAFQAPTSRALMDFLRGLPPERPSSQAVRGVKESAYGSSGSWYEPGRGWSRIRRGHARRDVAARADWDEGAVRGARLRSTGLERSSVCTAVAGSASTTANWSVSADVRVCNEERNLRLYPRLAANLMRQI